MDKTIEWYRCERQASPERIALVSQEIGVAFPPLFITLMSECDGGAPQKTDFEYYDQSLKHRGGNAVGAFLSFEESNCSLLKYYYSPPESCPEGLIVFANTGNGDYICFDYRQKENKDNPSIAYYSHEAPAEENIFFISHNFEEFIGMLKEEDDEAFLEKLRTEKDL